MKIVFICWVFLLVGAQWSTAQQKFKCTNGKVKFFSSAPLEDIEAISEKVSAIYNNQNGEVAAIIPISSFEFDNGLMQEHFNENYMESEKYPKASFSGKIEKPENNLPGTIFQTEVKGKLTIHGVTKERIIPLTLTYLEDGSVKVTSKFMVKVADHKIKIPSIVFQNIAEEVEVTLDLILKPID